MNLVELLPRLGNVKRTTAGWEAHCPAHEDRKASLCIGTGGDERILLKCQAGCSVESIVSAIGLKLADLFPSRSHPTPCLKRKFADASSAMLPAGTEGEYMPRAGLAPGDQADNLGHRHGVSRIALNRLRKQFAVSEAAFFSTGSPDSCARQALANGVNPHQVVCITPSAY